MAPIKFEENIKNKLEQRTVTPSSDAWSKLSQRLDAEDKRTKRSSFWWFGIAASVAALVFVSITYLSNDITEPVVPVLVEEKIDEIIKETNTSNTIEPAEAIAEQIPSIKEEDAIEEVNTPKIMIPEKNAIQKSIVPKTERIAEANSKPIEKIEQQNSVNPNIESPIKDIKLNTIVDAIAKTKNTTVTDQQIDSLLKSAHQEILKSRILKKANNVVDAASLLQDVEEDLGQSFRTKIYEALKDRTKKAKTAIANRNN